jgi:hypothetical protein
MNRSRLWAAAVAILAMRGMSQGQAADLGVIVPPPVAVVPAPVIVAPVLPHIWLGHFTGGAYLAPGAMDWHDEFARFPSRRECLHWLRALRAAYHAQEGFKTCVPIR